MKSFNLLTAILFLAFGSVALADDPTPANDADLAPVEEPVTLEGEYMPSPMGGAYTDFPNYYPGYTSYRGLGFMGSCCEQNSCCAQHAWDGYCEQKGGHVAKPFHGLCSKLHGAWNRPAYVSKTDCCPEPCCEVKPRHAWLSKLHCGLHQPKCGVDPCCDPCCEPKCGVETKCHKPLFGKLHGLRNSFGWWNGHGSQSYGEYYGPFDGKAMPTYTEPVPMDSDQQIIEPAPEATPESVSEPPAEITTDYVPNFPDITPDDRSAHRTHLHRLPEVL